MRHAIATQFIGHDLSGFTLVTANKTLEKPFPSCPISPGLKINIKYFTVLVNSLTQIVLLAVDLYKYFIDIERIAMALMWVANSYFTNDIKELVVATFCKQYYSRST